jgi:hypothetical protein
MPTDNLKEDFIIIDDIEIGRGERVSERVREEREREREREKGERERKGEKEGETG